MSTILTTGEQPNGQSSAPGIGQFDAADFIVVATVNDHAILDACLRRSPDVESGRLPLYVIDNAATMTSAYNQALADTKQPIILFAHQDVYFPKGFLDRAVASLNQLTIDQPEWLIAGPYGLLAGGQRVGCVWDVTLGVEVGAPGFAPTPIESLDELLLIMRRHKDLQFDPDLPHFHLYGTDIVQMAKELGGTTFAIDLPVVHNNRPTASLRGGYLKAYKYARRKWRAKLPIWTTISAITYCPFPLWRAQFRTRHVRKRPDGLLADAVEIAKGAGYE